MLKTSGRPHGSGNAWVYGDVFLPFFFTFFFVGLEAVWRNELKSNFMLLKVKMKVENLVQNGDSSQFLLPI